MMVAGEILDVVAEKVSPYGGARPLYGFTDAVHAVCKQKLPEHEVNQRVDRWVAHGHWKSRCPKPIQKWTAELPRVGNGPKQRAIDLYGIEELVCHFDPENIDSFRENYGFVVREEAGSKRSRAAGATQGCELAIPCSRSWPVSLCMRGILFLLPRWQFSLTRNTDGVAAIQWQMSETKCDNCRRSRLSSSRLGSSTVWCREVCPQMIFGA